MLYWVLHGFTKFQGCLGELLTTAPARQAQHPLLCPERRSRQTWRPRLRLASRVRRPAWGGPRVRWGSAPAFARLVQLFFGTLSVGSNPAVTVGPHPRRRLAQACAVCPVHASRGSAPGSAPRAAARARTPSARPACATQRCSRAPRNGRISTRRLCGQIGSRGFAK